jgi:hypothetical protein
MGEVSTIGLDIAKSVFQVHGVDGTGAVVMRKRIGRSKLLGFFGGLSPCVVGIEACSTTDSAPVFFMDFGGDRGSVRIAQARSWRLLMTVLRMI